MKSLTNPKQDYKKRGILSNQEIDLMLKEADKLPNDYFRLRAKALICIVKKFGKRRSEIAKLSLINDEGLSDLTLTNTDLEVTFHLSKKHKRGLHQYFKHCKKQGLTNVLEKPLPEIKLLWMQWQQTEAGRTTKNSASVQSISLNDKYTAPILEYIEFLKKQAPNCKYLFPSGLTVFGGNYMIFPNKNLSGSQLLRIIKPLKQDAWLHLFRETKGAEIVKQYGRTLTAIYEVKDGLDLENEETAYRYVRRYAAKRQLIER